MGVAHEFVRHHFKQAKFNFEYGVTNVWTEPAVRNRERLKIGSKAIHSNQKPEILIERIIRASSDEGDVVWEPFGGTCTAALVGNRLGRIVHAAEISPDFHAVAGYRLRNDLWTRLSEAA